jgi:hypothetical protein
MATVREVFDTTRDRSFESTRAFESADGFYRYKVACYVTDPGPDRFKARTQFAMQAGNGPWCLVPNRVCLSSFIQKWVSSPDWLPDTIEKIWVDASGTLHMGYTTDAELSFGIRGPGRWLATIGPEDACWRIRRWREPD